MGLPLKSPVAKAIVRGRDRGKRKEEEPYAPDPSSGKANLPLDAKALASHCLRWSGWSRLWKAWPELGSHDATDSG